MSTFIWRRAHRLLSAALSLPLVLAAQTQPAPPINVTATADQRGGVLVSWTGPRAQVFYRVLRSTDPRLAGADLARPALEPGTTAFTDAGAAAGTTYIYQVVAVYSDGTQGASIPIQYVPLTTAAPVLRASTGTLTVQPIAVATAVPVGPAPLVQVQSAGPLARTVSWSALTGVTGYNVSLATNATTGPWQLLNPAPLVVFSFTDGGLRQAGVTYRVTALYPDGRQGSADYLFSSPAPFEVPTAFAGEKLKVDGVLYGRTVRLSWKEVTWAKGYRLFGTGQPPGGTLLNAQLAPPPFFALPGPRTMEALLQNLPDAHYTWQLTADYGGAWQGAGLPTASVNVFDLCAPPQPTPGPAPDRVGLTTSGGGDTGYPLTVSLSWTRVSGAVAYSVERENYTGFGAVSTIGSSCGNLKAFFGMIVPPFKTPIPYIYFTDDTGGLVAGSGYRYRVTAFGAAGEKGSKTGVILVK